MPLQAVVAMPARKLAWQRRILQLAAAAYGLGAFACLLFADEMAAGMGIFLKGTAWPAASWRARTAAITK